MHLKFQALSEPSPGTVWVGLFERHWDAYQKWFLSAGDDARPSYLTARKKLREHFPELVPTWERLVELAGGGDLVARFLALYRPPPYISGCSQAVWANHRDSILVRNYDYAPQLCEASLLMTRWNGKRVIAMSDCLWGVLDGMNDSGLSVSLAFGGRREVGDGFGVPLILRYVLEFCDNCQQAIEVLQRTPTHMSYNVTLLDRHGTFRTLFLAPDRAPLVTELALATNHQRGNSWQRYTKATASMERERYLAMLVDDKRAHAADFIRSFQQAPLFSREYGRGFGTLYTSLYRPATGEMELRWPGASWEQSFDRFIERSVKIGYHGWPRRH